MPETREQRKQRAKALQKATSLLPIMGFKRFPNLRARDKTDLDLELPGHFTDEDLNRFSGIGHGAEGTYCVSLMMEGENVRIYGGDYRLVPIDDQKMIAMLVAEHVLDRMSADMSGLEQEISRRQELLSRIKDRGAALSSKVEAAKRGTELKRLDGLGKRIEEQRRLCRP